MTVFEFFQGLKTVNTNKHCSLEDKEKNILLCNDVLKNGVNVEQKKWYHI
jgi:hypothetical protein